MIRKTTNRHTISLSRYFLILWLIFNTFTAGAQQDSLLQIVNNTTNDSIRATAYRQLAKLNTQSDSIMEFYQLAIRDAKSSQLHKELIQSYYDLALYYISGRSGESQGMTDCL